MTSLTPKHRSEEVVNQAMKEGLTNGGMILIPSMGGLYAALQNARFRKVRRTRTHDPNASSDDGNTSIHPSHGIAPFIFLPLALVLALVLLYGGSLQIGNLEQLW